MLFRSSFEPKIVAKRQRRLTGVDDMVISLSAKGLTHGEISAHLAEVYGAEVSKQTITTPYGDDRRFASGPRLVIAPIAASPGDAAPLLHAYVLAWQIINLHAHLARKLDMAIHPSVGSTDSSGFEVARASNVSSISSSS